MMSGSEKKFTNTRSSPRSTIPLEVDVEISGQTQKVLLISRDIGAGGVFLRTRNPCELWKKVKLSLKSPTNEAIEVTGEVVRRVTVDQAKKTKHPPGIAVAFDEVSRTKRKELISLVLDLCSMRESVGKIVHEHAERVSEDDSVTHLSQDTSHPEKKTDELLDNMDRILDSQQAPMEAGTEISLDAKTEPDKDETGSEFQSLKASLKDYKAGLRGDNYYELLGLEPNATKEQITVAYRNLMTRFKPPTPLEQLPKDLVRELSNVLGKIRKAFSILSRPDRKRAYDFLIDND